MANTKKDKANVSGTAEKSVKKNAKAEPAVKAKKALDENVTEAVEAVEENAAMTDEESAADLLAEEVNKEAAEAAAAAEAEAAREGSDENAPVEAPRVWNKDELQKKLAAETASFEHEEKELGDELKALLTEQIGSLKRQDGKRGRELLGIFARHNFYANGISPEELRTTLEDMGPTYVKIGQIMSSRVDMLPEEYCKELEKLRQNVKELDPKIARAVIEDETGRKIEDIFSEFRDEPIGSASIGQVHYAVMKDGTKVVIKVQRPLISERMRQDFELLKKLAPLLNGLGGSSGEDSALLDLGAVLEELEKVTLNELDFRIEAAYTRFFKEYCFEDEEKITCPTVIDELTTERMFTMTYVDGCSIGKKDRLIEEGCDPMELGRVIIENFIHQVLDIGVFHGDPHQGNIMVSKGKVYWIDFGAVGEITEADVNTLTTLIISLVKMDLEGLTNAVMGLGLTSPSTNRDKLMEDLDLLIHKYMNVSSLNDIDLSALLGEITDLCAKHHISIPGKYTMLVRSLATIEGVLEQLCPELNLFEFVSDKMLERAKRNFDLAAEVRKFGEGFLDFGKKAIDLPGMALSALSGVMKGRTKINLALTGYEESLEKIGDKVNQVVMVLVACVLFFGSCILCMTDIQPKTPNGVPLIAAIGLLFSISFGIFAMKKLLKK